MAKKKQGRDALPPDPQATSDSSVRMPDRLPKDLPADVIQIVREVIEFQGPLPPPTALRKYDEIVPGSAARIVKGSEDERFHRHRIEAAETATRGFQIRGGLIFGFMVTVLGIGGSILLGMNGHEETAKVLGGSTLAAIAAVFVAGRVIPHLSKRPTSPTNNPSA